MPDVQEIMRGLWSFPIVLPDNPLKWLNCYVIKGSRSLLIDTGFNMEPCRADLLRGMEALGLTPYNTDVFLTHFHSDHIGNAAFLEKLGFKLMMGQTDYKYFCIEDAVRLKTVMDRMRLEGMTKEDLEAIYRIKGPHQFAPVPFHASTVNDAECLNYGDYCFKCIETPGHTPGHVCLYDEDKQLMLSGDHILFDITPNICIYHEFEDSLGHYLESLSMMELYPVRHALPAHRNCSDTSLHERAVRIKQHHERRLGEILDILGKEPVVNAQYMAKHMTWKIRAKNWDDFPPSQKFFALNETLAHVDYLLKKNEIRRKISGEGFYFYSK